MGSQESIITWSTQIRNLQKSLHLTAFQRSVLIGALMGDAALVANDAGKNYRLQMEQCNKQKEYIDWKFNVFRKWCLKPSPVFQEEKKSWRFRTISHPELTQYHEMFYSKKGKKNVPAKIEELLDPLSLAIWFMDDGSFGPSTGLTINTQNFSQKGQNFLRELLLKKFCLKTTLHRDRSYWRIYLLQDSVPIFQEIIGKWVVPSMRYKLRSLTP